MSLHRGTRPGPTDPGTPMNAWYSGFEVLRQPSISYVDNNHLMPTKYANNSPKWLNRRGKRPGTCETRADSVILSFAQGRPSPFGRFVTR